MPPAVTVRALAVLVLALLSLLPASPAQAHASLLSASPADGSVVASAPATLTLTFNEQVSPVTLRLISPDGRGTTLRPNADGSTVEMAAPTDLGNGTYVLSWRVISADGHPVGGSTTFSIGAPSSGGAPTEDNGVDWPVRAGVWATRVLTYAGLFVGIGGIFFARWFAGGAGLRSGRIVTTLGLVALPFSVGFQGLDVLDWPVGGFFTADAWQEGISSTFGLFVAIVLAGYLLALVPTGQARRSRLLSALAFVCVGAALAATGHASTTDPQWLTRSAVFIHASVLCFWIGALAPLAAVLGGPAEAAVLPLKRFSALITPLLLLLLASGVALAAVQLGSPGELLDTDYGRVFVAKMVLVAILLGIAGFNRWGLTGQALGDALNARRHLARSISVELAIVLVIFGVVALWRFTPPPRALLEAAAQPIDLHLMTDEAMAEMTMAPGHAGPVTVDLALMAPDMGPLKAQAVTVDFANKDKGVEAIERQAKLQADGSWHIGDLTLPVGGNWQVEVAILVSDFKEIDLSDEVTIKP